MIVLDTNVLSELMRPKPDRRVVEWLDNQDPLSMAISAMQGRAQEKNPETQGF